MYRGVVDLPERMLNMGVAVNVSEYISFRADLEEVRRIIYYDRRPNETYIIFKIATQSVPDTARVVYRGGEVLFPPGVLTFNYKPNEIVEAVYKPHLELIDNGVLLLPPMPSREADAAVTDEDLIGADVVFYRAVLGRPVELLGCSRISKEYYETNIGVNIPRYMDDYRRHMRYITSYTDLLRKIKSDEYKQTASPEQKLADGHLYLSYHIHAAVWHRKRRQVIMMDLAIGDKMFRRMYGDAIGHREDEIREVVKLFCQIPTRKFIERPLDFTQMPLVRDDIVAAR